MSKKLFKNKEDYENFVKRYDILNNSKSEYESTVKEFLKFLSDMYNAMLKKDPLILFSSDELDEKVAFRKKLIELGKLKDG